MRTTPGSGGRRIEQLYEISKLFTVFANTEITVDAALRVIAGTLPLESAILIEAVIGGHSDMIVWPSHGFDAGHLQAAKAHAEQAYAYLVGAHSTEGLELREELGPSTLPAPHDRGHPARRFIVIPLVVGGGGVFGVLQLEGAASLDRDDLEFINTITNQLSIALDRDRVWRHDVVRRRNAQNAQAKYENLVDHLDYAFVWEADPETQRMTYISAQFEPMLGASRHQVLDEPDWWLAHAHPDDRPALSHMFSRALIDPGDKRCDHRYVMADGGVRWLHTSVHLVGGAGEVPRLQGVSFDITDARLAQERVREQLALSTAMAGSLGEGALAIDLDDRITFINDAGAALLRCTPHETVGRRSADIAHVEDNNGIAVESPLSTAIRTGSCVRSDDFTLVRADGTRVPASVTAAPIRRDNRVTGAVLAFDDISERKSAQEVERFLLDAGTQLSSTLETKPVVDAIVRLGVPRLGDICFLDLVENGRSATRVAWAHRDANEQTVLDRTFGDVDAVAFLALPVLDVLETGLPLHVRVVAGVRISRDDVRVATTLGIRTALITPCTIGRRQLGALTFCMLDDRELGERDIALAEELARRGALAIEHARLYEQARDAVALREQTLAVVSHDLRTPLATIMMASTILGDEELARSSRWTTSLAVEKIQTAASRMERLIGDLLDFASIEAGQLAMTTRPEDVASIVKESIAGFEEQARARGVRLVSETAPGIPRVDCDRDRVLQVIGNLVGNALKILKSGDAITLRVKARQHEAVFAVEDTGPGISLADQKHLFDRYFRGLHARYKGSGLGLSIAHGLVEGHGGRIWVDSELGHGATFFFTIPLSASPERS